MSGPPDPASESDRTERLFLLKRKLQARDKVLLHLEQRLNEAPDNQHWLFLKDEHEKVRAELYNALRQLERERQGTHRLTEWVEGYLSQWDDSCEDVLDPGESEATTQKKTLSAEQQHELEIWQGLLRKVEARLLRLPGDPRLVKLRASHQARIQALQNVAAEPESISNTVSEPISAPTPQPAKSRTREQIEKELEIWAKLIQKSQERLAAKPELVHLRGMITEHQTKMAGLMAELQALPAEQAD
ncbi:MAG: hypothetical protein AB7I41_15040 [Candidatus Sericytochromatia bacterium]